jgi:tetratricopeptide (TPR) repeat protein
MGEPEAVLIDKIIVEEESCNWENAIKLYNEIIETCLNSEDYESAGKYYMKLGNAHEQLGFTVETTEEFLEYNRKSKESYKKAENLFIQTNDNAEELESKALGIQVEKIFTIEELKPRSKRVSELLLESYENYLRKNDLESCSRVLSTSIGALLFNLYLPEDKEEFKQDFDECIDLIDKAKKLSKKVGDRKNLVKIMSYESNCVSIYFGSNSFRSIEHWKNYEYNLIIQFDKFLEENDSIKDITTLSTFYSSFGYLSCFYGFHYVVDDEVEQSKYMNKGLQLFEKALGYIRNE